MITNSGSEVLFMEINYILTTIIFFKINKIRELRKNKITLSDVSNG